MDRTPEYEAYHKQVVEACVRVFGERARHFFDVQCSYEEEFAEGCDPEEVAIYQLEALE